MQIQNVISTANLMQRVDVSKFNNYSWGRYDQDLYGGRCGYVKDERIEGRVTVFFSGKMISTGAKSVNSSFRQLEYSTEMLTKSGFVEMIELKPHVQNIVATLDTKGTIDLNSLTMLNKIIYEPEQFPGAILKTSLGPTCLIFASGKIVIAGAKSKQQLNKTVSLVIDVVREFQPRTLSEAIKTT